MLKTRAMASPGTSRRARPGPAAPGSLRAKGNLVAYVGDVVGTGSSRKSATNSVLWFTGEDIPFVPNKRFGGVCLAPKSPRSSSTPWKTPARCRSKSTRPNGHGRRSRTDIDRHRQSHRHQNGAVIAETTLKTR